MSDVRINPPFVFPTMAISSGGMAIPSANRVVGPSPRKFGTAAFRFSRNLTRALSIVVSAKV